MEWDPSLTNNFLNFDHWLFQKINSEWTNGVFDLILPWLTDLNHNRYLPFLLLAFALVWVAKQRYRAMMYILVLVMAVGAADLFAYRVVKTIANRNRPEQAGVHVVLRTEHHSGPSFPSNHAANSFAAAGILSAAFPVGTPFFYLGAFAIAYSRVYVGVHFPSDVIAGAFMGWLIAFMIRILLSQLIVKAELSEEHRFEEGFNRAERDRRRRLMKGSKK